QLIARTQQKEHPVMAYRKYGKGHILVITAPLAIESGVLSQLLLNAVRQFSSDIYSGSDLTRVLPIEFTLTNDEAEEKTVTLKEILPYGVEAYGYAPEPVETTEDDELKWKITVPANDEAKVTYWLKLPDTIGSYEVKTEIYSEDTKLDEATLTVDVSQDVFGCIDELVAELGIVDATGRDAQFTRRAARRLQKIGNRNGDGMMVQLSNLFDAVKAAYLMGKVRNVDVSVLKTDRRYHENHGPQVLR
ncbi:MAG: DUF4139 domain-containing protein, partial [bacterium]|nr:DUF4139 domain-containing protein [bacterium]